MILSSKLNKDPSPFTQHLRSAPSDLPVQPEIQNRTRGDSDHSAREGYQAKDRKTVLSSNSAQLEGRMKKTYPNLMNDGESESLLFLSALLFSDDERIWICHIFV